MISPVAIRRVILEQSFRAGVGHIGSALSSADIVATLLSSVLNRTTGDHHGRDRFILSNGHAALAVYASLYLLGKLSAEDLNTYCADGSLLGVHPQHSLPDIDFTTGSLGHGLPLGTGAALAARLHNSTRRAFVVLSDAECNEGSTWEAIMFAAHHELSNLIAIVDLNRQQAFGYTKDVLNLNDMAKRWSSFGWDAKDVDGHDALSLAAVISELDVASGPPHVLVAHTIFGRGVSFMERQIKWHYSPLSEPEYVQALAEINHLT